MPAAEDDAVFVAVRREYRSRTLDLQRDTERRDELVAQVLDLERQMINSRRAIAQLTDFAARVGWNIKDFKP